MRCPSCDGENPTDGQFCIHCGAELPSEEPASQEPGQARPSLCPSCGKENPAVSRYCISCGSKLPSVEITPQDAEPLAPSIDKAQEAAQEELSSVEYALDEIKDALEQQGALPDDWESIRHSVLSGANKLEELHHLRYLKRRLEAWERRRALASVSHLVFVTAFREIGEDIERLEEELGIAPRPRVAEAPVVEPAVPTPTATPVAPEEPAAQPQETAPPRREYPTMPPREPFSWAKVGDALLSRRTLQTFLYIGSTLLVLSAIILVVRLWADIHWVPRQAILLVGMVALLWSGFHIRYTMGLRISGGVLMDIGALWVPLNVGALLFERLGVTGDASIPGIDVPLGLPMGGWMAIAAISTPVYAFLAYRYRLVLLAHGAAIGLAATLMTGLAALDVALEWQLASIIAISPAYMWVIRELRGRGLSELEQNLFWLVQAAVPALLITVVALVAAEDGSRSAVTVSAWSAVLFYAVSFRIYRHLAFESLAAFGLLTALLLTLSMHASTVPIAWYNLVLVGTTIAYIAAARYIRKSPLWARSDDSAMSVSGFRVDPLYVVALVTAAAAAIWPVATIPSATVSLYALVILLGAVAWLFQQRSAAYLAAFLLFAPIALTIHWAEVDAHWRALLFAPLAMAYLVAAEAISARDGETRLPLVRLLNPVVSIKGLFTRPLFLAGYASTLVAIIFAAVELFNNNAAQNLEFVGAGPAPWTFLWVAGIYIVSAYLRRTSIFVHLAAWGLLPFVLLLAERGFYLGWSFESADYFLLLGGLSLGYLAVGVILDRLPGHYSKALYLVGYALTAVGMVGTYQEKVFSLSLVSMAVAVYAVSAYLAHSGRHPAFHWLVEQVFPDKDDLARRVARGFFLYLTAGLFPVAVLLALSMGEPVVAWYGVTLTFIGLGYLGIAEVFSYRDAVYRYQWYIIGAALSIIGPLVTLGDPTLRLVAIGAAVLGYGAMAALTRRPLWIYPVAILLPALAILGMDRANAPPEYYGVALLGLAVIYGAVGLVWKPDDLGRLIRPQVGRAGSFVLPFFLVAFVLSAVGIGLSAMESNGIIVLTLAIGSLYYLLATIALRQTLLLYPVAALLSAAYGVGLTITGVDSQYYGLLLLPGVVIVLAVALVLEGHPNRYRFGSWFLPLRSDQSSETHPKLSLLSPMLPFALAAYAGSVAVPILSSSHGWPLFWGLTSVAAIYGYSAWRFHTPLWSYVALLAAHIALVRLLFLLSPGMSVALVGVYMVPAAYLVAGLGVLAMRLQRRTPKVSTSTFSMESMPALTRRWALPFFIVALLGAASSTILASFQADTGLAAALAYSIPLAAGATLARRQVPAWAALSFLALAFVHGLRLGEVSLLDSPVYIAVLAAALVTASYFIRQSDSQGQDEAQLGPSPWAVWKLPLRAFAFLAIGLAPILGLSAWLAEGAASDDLQPLVFTLAITGLTLVGVAYLQRRAWLTYLAVALLGASYMTQLAVFDTGQAQFFVIPAALYLMAVAYLERGRRHQALVTLLESAGLALLLGVTLLQSLGLFTNDVNHQLYSLLLFFESLLVVLWGLSVRWKRPLFGGIAAFIANLAILLFDPLGEGPVSATILWAVFGGVGIALVGSAVYLERNRERSSAALRRVIDQLAEWS